MQEHLFVSGCPRSGTTALAQLLNSHPAIFIGIERYHELLRRTGNLTPDLFIGPRFFDIREGDTHYESFDALDVLRIYKTAEERLSRAQFVGDKIPTLYEFYTPIAEAFPDARFIYILRNIFDVAVSYKQRAQDETDLTWGPQRGVDVAIEEWNASLSATCNFIRAGGRLHIVLYEELLLQRLGFGSLSRFLGVSLSSEASADLSATAPRSPDVTLTPTEKCHILQNADFEAYRNATKFASRE